MEQLFCWILENQKESILGVVFTFLFGWIPFDYIIAPTTVELIDLLVKLFQIISLNIGFALSCLLIFVNIKKYFFKKKVCKDIKEE